MKETLIPIICFLAICCLLLFNTVNSCGNMVNILRPLEEDEDWEEV